MDNPVVESNIDTTKPTNIIRQVFSDDQLKALYYLAM